jgi:predicted Zn-dependent protease
MLSTVLMVALGSIVAAQPANAYATTGCKWPTGALSINISYVNGNFRTAINQARSNYTSATDVDLTTTDSSGPTFTAANSNYGATGWEGQASWTCLFGTTTAVQARLNQYYLSGSEPVTRLKVVWAHEIGHGLGLDHVSTVARVMYTSASAAYNAGVTGLTSDEINGINALY